MSDIFSGGTFFVGYRVCACAFTEIYMAAFSREECYVYILFVVLAKVSTFTDGFVLEGGITNCRVNQ